MSKEMLKTTLSIGPIDKDKAEKAVKNFYKHANKPKPRVIWFDSPAQGIEMAARFSKIEQAEQITKNANWTFKQIEEIEISKKEIQEMAYKTFFESSQEHYFCFYEFMTKELLVKMDNSTDITVCINEQLVCHWLFDKAAILTAKPVEMYIKNNMSHNTTGPALRYADGKTLYFINGNFKKELNK